MLITTPEGSEERLRSAQVEVSDEALTDRQVSEEAVPAEVQTSLLVSEDAVLQGKHILSMDFFVFMFLAVQA